MDYGHEQADKRLKALERALTKEYKQAGKELESKLQDYLEKFQNRDAEMLKKLSANAITEAEYLKWRQNQMLTGQRWQDMVDTIAHDMSQVNQISAGMITETMADVYAINANYAMYEVEGGLDTGVSFTLYNRDTVNRMIRDKKFPIPTPRTDIPKDLRWNEKKINSAILQGVLQGESIPKIANRLQSVTDMNRKSAIRNARTYITGAENRGRIDTYEYAESIGIEMEQEWVATMDDRTRESHIDLDGMRIEVGGMFPNGCRYPGDPDGPPEEIYNCRCGLVGARKGKKYQVTRNTDKMSYEEWAEKKAQAEEKYGYRHTAGAEE